MIKRLFLIFLACISTVQAQDVDPEAVDIAFQGLIYDIGMSLSDQDVIFDRLTAKDALLHVYHEVEQATQIVDLLLVIDEETIEQNITTVDELIDYKMNSHDDVERTLIAWLAAYQNLFTVFIALHDSDVSFDTWCCDVDFVASLQDYQEITDSGYVEFWHASYVVMEAQRNFELALKSAEN